MTIKELKKALHIKKMDLTDLTPNVLAYNGTYNLVLRNDDGVYEVSVADFAEGDFLNSDDRSAFKTLKCALAYCLKCVKSHHMTLCH